MYHYSFEKLDVWKDAKDLAKHIYEITKKFPSDEKFGFVAQLRRASISIASNIAEGSARKTSKDQAHFYVIAFSSSIEVLNQIIICYELEFISEDTYVSLRTQIERITNRLNALRKSRLNE
ncbi:MAG: four helix bundle protein [Bacteroidota bacterium]